MWHKTRMYKIILLLFSSYCGTRQTKLLVIGTTAVTLMRFIYPWNNINFIFYLN